MNTNNLSNIAVIGSGPTALYLLKHIWEHIDVLKSRINRISIFEKETYLGMGMPYNPDITDIYNLSNISSEEIPMLQDSFGDWLRKQNLKTLKKLNVEPLHIDDTKVYSRIALGYYFQDQFKQLISAIKSKGILVFTYCECEVVDISQVVDNELIVTDCYNKVYSFSTVVIANGHQWKGEDKIEAGFYTSPWPICKLLPKENEFFNFTVGLLGASLSAFDVVSSLSHRHGVFKFVFNKLKFIKHAKAPNFKIVLHSSKGWLPHLQYEQQKPIREIYRHFSRNQLLELIDAKGFLQIDDYFDYLCRSPLISAFRKDKLLDVVENLQSPSFRFKDLVTCMSEKHQYVNSFKGMKAELKIAKKSVYRKTPIYWMETLDDLMYSLNYHAELLSAEDHVFFHKEIMSFLMNVIAALPLQSAEILLALYDANCIELKAGIVSVKENSFDNNKTKISLELDDGSIEELEYKMFIDCSGQKTLEIEDYPFQTLVEKGIIQNATAKFADPKNAKNKSATWNHSEVIYNSDDIKLKIRGVDIDASYRTINKEGAPNNCLYDINFTHISGLRPYSYGLQACSATSLILVESWVSGMLKYENTINEIANITELYENIEGL